jgi:DNA-binding GntR family transcriptional regulator
MARDEDQGDATSAERAAYTYLHNRIRRGELKPGSRLRPEEIAGEIGMSRMPVREAFRRLDAEGLLVIRPNRGAVVADCTAEQLLELFEMRSVLEGLAMRHAVANVGGMAIEDLRDLLFRMDRGQHECDQWLKRHWSFHEYLCVLSNRPRLVREIERLHVMLEPQMRFYFINVKKPVGVLQQHQNLIDVLVAGDADRAETVMREHVLETAPALIAFLNSSIETGTQAT